MRCGIADRYGACAGGGWQVSAHADTVITASNAGQLEFFRAGTDTADPLLESTRSVAAHAAGTVVTDLALDPSGRSVASVGEDGRVCVTEIESGHSKQIGTSWFVPSCAAAWGFPRTHTHTRLRPCGVLQRAIGPRCVRWRLWAPQHSSPPPPPVLCHGMSREWGSSAGPVAHGVR